MKESVCPVSGQPATSIFLAPAVSPWETTLPGVMGGKGNNPAIRLLEYDRQTGNILNIQQYYLDLQEANALQKANWTLEYKATEYFSVADLGASSLDQLAKAFRVDDDLFDRYYKANGVLYDPNEEWDSEMRLIHICAITELDYDDYGTCLERGLDRGNCNTYSAMALAVAATVAHMLTRP